jgi:phosphatidylethanolamine/phosphatidyl-N-methylethanolamine N-methyltransferase
MLQPDAGSVIRSYDRYSRIYDFLYGRVLQDGRRALSRAIRAGTGQDVLELGVGSGLMLPLYPAHFRVVGVDISPGMLARAQRRVARLGLRNVQLRLADAERTGLPDEAYDQVTLPYVYSVTPSPLRLLHEAFRVCRPGGTIWILNHFSGNGFWDGLERPLKPFARWLGFRPDFPFQGHITDLELDIQAVKAANLLGLSRLVQIRRGTRIPRRLLPGLAREAGERTALSPCVPSETGP